MVTPPPRLTALLLTPGDRADRFAKAVASGADGIIIDLDAAVPAKEKARARGELITWLRKPGAPDSQEFVKGIRLNSLRVPEGRADLEALYSSNPSIDFVILPKVESAAEVQLATRKLPPRVHILCMIESVVGVRFVGEIATASPRVAGLVFSGVNLSADTGGEPTWDALLYPRTKLVHACTAAGIPALDQPYPDFRDLEGLEKECPKIRALGFSGKIAIHPGQCPIIRTAFLPTAEQVDRARRIVTEYDALDGKNVVVDGRPIDAVRYRVAQHTLRHAAP